MSANDLESNFVNITINDDLRYNDKLYEALVGHSQHSRVDTETIVCEALRKDYPGHSLVIAEQPNVLSFGGAEITLDRHSERIMHTQFSALSRRSSQRGVLREQPVVARYSIVYKERKFILYYVQYYPTPGWRSNLLFYVHKGPEEHIRELLLAAGIESEELHNEIWVYEGNYWQKDAKLWEEVQKANWDDIILDDHFKKGLRDDIDGFYSQEKIYKKLGIPWKRGMIFFGPAGNGKTITMKAIMKYSIGVPLYVRSFQNWQGPEQAMREVFNKARMEAPCLVVFEDLDALINNSNRSFFLNQIDGLEGNDGLLLIATTNHIERLDPALSNRPSRFDRKYDFADPSKSERMQYCHYWQEKLSDNKDIEFPDSLCETIADQTIGFSFAYLKEAFVSTLVLIATGAEKGTFAVAIQKTIKELQKQIGGQPLTVAGTAQSVVTASSAITSAKSIKQLVGL